MIKYTRQQGRDLYEHLNDRGCLEYGSITTGSTIRDFLGIELPEIGTKEQFTNASLSELKAVDYIRETLLGQGKYLASSQDSYRVLLPSENAVQCDRYISSATKKLNRSLKLSRNTPHGDHVQPDTQTSRALLKKASLRPPPGQHV